MLNKEKVSLGIAPIGWTNDDMPDLGKENTFEQTVSEMALAGFTGSEVGSHYPTDPEVLKKALDLRGMTICNQWFSSFLISRPYEETEAAFMRFSEESRSKMHRRIRAELQHSGKTRPSDPGRQICDE